MSVKRLGLEVVLEDGDPGWGWGRGWWQEVSPGSNVIILTTPAPVFIGEAIHLQVLVRSERRDPAKVLGIWEARERKSPGFHISSGSHPSFFHWMVEYPASSTLPPSTCIQTCSWQQQRAEVLGGRTHTDCGRSLAGDPHHAGTSSPILHHAGPPAPQHSAALPY